MSTPESNFTNSLIDLDSVLELINKLLKPGWYTSEFVTGVVITVLTPVVNWLIINNVPFVNEATKGEVLKWMVAASIGAIGYVWGKYAQSRGEVKAAAAQVKGQLEGQKMALMAYSAAPVVDNRATSRTARVK